MINTVRGAGLTAADVYDPAGNWIGSEPITYRDVPPLLTPEVILNLGVEWARGIARVGLMGRYIDEAQLDNTGLPEFRTPPLENLDLRASVDLGHWWEVGNPRLTLFVNNLFDSLDRYPSGYSYQFLIQDGAGQQLLDGIPFYYPLATRNAILTLELGF
jgi:hypothetical protein